jgi:hypothetical protein
MTSEEITHLVEAQINGHWSCSNAHGVDLRKCLVTPRKMLFDGSNPDDKFELWLVLEECPEDCSGYKIVFDEETGEFGLATPGWHNNPCFLGAYGSFFDAFDAM